MARPAATERSCHICGTRAPVHPLVSDRYVVDPACPRCLMPYAPPPPETSQIETILLSMIAIPWVLDACGPAIRILTHLAPTCDEVERIRAELHRIDVPALAARTRAEAQTRRGGLAAYDDSADVEARLRNMVGAAESGLLRWRIDQLCRTACIVCEAREHHHRQILESTP